MKNLNSSYRVGLVLVLSLSLGLSCAKKSEADAITEAQQCLDTATAANVDNCIAKVAGYTSSQAYGIRCYGAFIREGFASPSKIVSAANSVSSGISSSNYQTFLGLVTFTSQGASGTTAATNNYNLAKDSSTTCAMSKVKSGTLLSTFAFLANALYKVGCTAGTPGNCTCATTDSNCIPYGAAGAALNTGNAQDSLLSDLGTVVVNAYIVACDSGAKTDTMCTKIKAAITSAGGTSNTKAVGSAFITAIST